MNEQIKDLMKHFSHCEESESRESFVEALASPFSLVMVRRMAVAYFQSKGQDQEIGSVY